MLARARRERREEGGLGLIIVDYMQLVSHHDRDVRVNEYRTVTECSKALLGMAKSLKVPVLALSQLRRPGAGEKSGEGEYGGKTQLPRPTLDMLRSSGQIEQDAHVVMFIHKNTLYLGKNRGGAKGHDIDLVFHPSFMQFNEKTVQEEC
jgi:replicative DNA helicase